MTGGPVSQEMGFSVFETIAEGSRTITSIVILFKFSKLTK